MLKDLNISMLLDFYRPMLTEKQIDAIDLYYNNDLSLSEIAAHLSVTRQGVRDLIKRGEESLLKLEKNLGLVDKFFTIGSSISDIKNSIEQIDLINTSEAIKGFVNSIKKDIDNISELI